MQIRPKSDGREWRPHGQGKPRDEYRAWLKNNAVRWYGVSPERIKVLKQPELVRNRHGHTNFSRKNNAFFTDP